MPFLRHAPPAALLALFSCAALAACNARKSYPDPTIGWHNADYSTVFGRIERIPGPAPEDPATWTLVFDDPSEPMSGQFALAPPEKLKGYSGGERVEVRGHLLNQPTTDRFNGRWYVVDSIRMWSGQR